MQISYVIRVIRGAARSRKNRKWFSLEFSPKARGRNDVVDSDATKINGNSQ